MCAACRVTRDRKKRKNRPDAGFLFVWSRVTRHASRIPLCHATPITENRKPITRFSSAAFTLLELLMSIAIMAFLFAVGVGTYWRMTRGYALQAGVSTTDSTLHGARALAIQEHSPADVMVVERQVDPAPALPHIERIYVVGKRTVSCWHFELEQFNGNKLLGALGQEGTVEGTAVSAPGRIGRALALDGMTHVSVTSSYLDAIRDGVFAEAFVWPRPNGPANDARLVVASRSDGAGKAFSLALRCKRQGTGQPFFWLEGTVTTDNQTLTAHTDTIIPAGEWTHVALSYAADGTDTAGNPLGVVLLVNGQEVDRFDAVAGNGLVATNTGPLYLGGDPGDCFVGYLDEVKIAARVKGEVRLLPKNTLVTRENATVLASQDAVAVSRAVRFDDEGKLDGLAQKTVARFFVLSPSDGLRRIVQVSRLGRIEVLSDGRDAQ